MRKAAPRSRKESGSSGEQGFWPSYTDMMSAVALILFFLMLLAYIQNIITNNDLSHKEEELRDTITKLASVSQQVKDKESELQEASDNLETARKDLDDQQIQLDSQHASIIEQANMILQQQTDIESQKATIEQQKQWIAQQQQYLDDTQAELTEVRGQMQAAAFLRVDIVEKIRESAESVLGTNSSISVSETGSLVLSESVLFDRGSPALKANSKAVLDQLAIGFANFLANSDSAQYVDTIVIGGHADSTGDESYNRSLSSNRATNVLQYLMTTQNSILNPYAQYFCAAGYGSTRPVATNDTPEGQAQNRRIEIYITLKDESVLEALEQYLAIKIPGEESSS